LTYIVPSRYHPTRASPNRSMEQELDQRVVI
jgi:hypothetical protein